MYTGVATSCVAHALHRLQPTISCIHEPSPLASLYLLSITVQRVGSGIEGVGLVNVRACVSYINSMLRGVCRRLTYENARACAHTFTQMVILLAFAILLMEFVWRNEVGREQKDLRQW
jgi:hypothetical protein